MPTVGLYVQVDCVHNLTDETCLFEGEIGGRNDTQAWFTWESGPVDSTPWLALRWRYRLEPPAIDSILRARELETT